MKETTTDDRHLSDDEVPDALSYRLSTERARHLTSCRVCQETLVWERMLALGTLWGLEEDWTSRVYKQLARGIRRRGNGLVYAVPDQGQYSRIVRMRFEPPSITKIRTKF